MSEKNMDVNGYQIYVALNKITEDAKKQRKEKGLDFRFLDKLDNKTEEEKKTAMERVVELEKELEKTYGIVLEFYEDIDIKNTSKGHKFYFRIYDDNNCFVEIDALEYRNVVIDSAKSEIDYIVEMIFKLMGLKVQENVLKISELITELISYVYYYDELQYKVYENIGWDTYSNKAKNDDKDKLIFKYDRIYKRNQEIVRSACLNEIAGKLTNEYTEDTKIVWRDKLAKLMNSSTVARIVISAACTGLIRSIMPYNKENNINMNICGKPGTGKSSLTQFALSIFGDPHALEGSFIDKDNAMEIIRVKRPVIPYILDDRMLKIDTLSDKAKSKELLFDVFREYEGKVTERMGGKYNELSGKRTNAPIISSSVESMLDVLLKSGDDLGQYRRFIELELKREDVFNGDSRTVDEYHKLSYQNYGIGFQYIVDYILNMGIEFVNQLYDCILNDITEKLDKKSNETGISGLTSSASRFALIATTYVIIRESINNAEIESETDNEQIGYNNKISDVIDMMNSENKEKENVAELSLYMEQMTKYYSRNSVTNYIVPGADEGYDQLVEYLIDNLVEKMGRVVYRVKVYENIMKFLKKEENKKWFVETEPKNFFEKYMTTHIGAITRENGSITITYKAKRYVEWLFCSDINLSDEQIKDYLAMIKFENKDRKKKEEELRKKAISLFGEDIVDKTIKEQVEKYKNLKYEFIDRVTSVRNIESITITRPTLEEKEEQE